MKNRRAFLAASAAIATLTSLPGLRAVAAAATTGGADRDGLAAFRAMLGERIPLREGGSVVVAAVDAVGSDPRWEQCLVRMVPSAPMDSGIYRLQTARGSRSVYVESGGQVDRPTLTAAFSRLRA